MKKIYIFTAVLALLTLSLNAQLKAHKNGTAVPPKLSTEQVDKEVTKPDGYFRMGPSRVSTNPVTPPYSNDFNSSDKWNWWEVIDANEDGTTWTLYSNTARYSYDWDNAGNDWLITAPVTLKAGKTYKFYIDAWVYRSNYPEKLEVKMASANTATDLSNGTTVIGSTTLSNTSATTLSNENVTVSQDGNYYFGIHAISDVNQYYLYVDNLVIDVEITDPTIQTSASSVTMNSIPGGTETQTVTVTGIYLTDNITTSISGTNAAMFSVSPASLGNSGGELTISYTPTAVGSHTATLTLSSTGAEDVTITLNGTCTQELTICEGNTEIANLPVYGNYNEQYQINQMIYPADKLSGLVGKDLTSMTFYATANLSSSLAGSVWSVKLGTTDQTSFASSLSNITRLEPSDIQTVITGYALPVGENLMTIVFSSPFTYNGGNLLVDFESTTKGSTYTPTNFYGVNQGSDIGYYSYASSNTSTSNGHYSGGYTTTNLPKVTFTFEDSEPRHDLAIALTEPDAVVAGETATITATVTNKGNQTETGYTVTITVDGTPTTLTGGTLAPNATETFTIQYPTTAAQGGNTVSVAANVACTDDANLNDNDATASLQVNAQVQDLAIALNAPASVVGGNTATVTATVTNTGNQPMTGYTVTITDGTNNLLNQTATEPLAPGATATYSAEYNTTAAQVGNTVNFAANVTCADDADATNNSATASMQIITMPAPENVAVTTGSNQSATMTWDAPSIESTSQTVEWDFEEEADFNAFTIVDADGDNYNWYYSNSEDEVTHSGTGVATSESYVNTSSTSGTALDPDNWLISPEITLGGNLSFWVAGQDPDWPSENFAVYVCEGPYSSTSDFVKIGDYTATATMTEIPVDLSQYEGQGYFAIRHYNMTGNDMFRLNIDDISYSTREDAIFPVSYNIYLDGEFMGNVDANTFSYTFNNVSGEHTASVSAVYPGGIESAAVPAEFTILPTPNAPAVSSNDGTTSTTITITPDANTDGQLVYYVDYNGSQTQDLTFPRGANDYTVEVHAYTTATSNYNQSPEAVVTVTIPALPQTAAPTIGISSETDEEVTITATGNGTVTLTINGQTVQGTGSASITVPRHMQDYTVTATATAQVNGELVSTTTTEEITIESMTTAGGWLPIEGTYTGDEPISLIDEATHKLIKFEDHFSASTMYNAHADQYDYIIREENNPKTSNTVTIPVFKTYSIMNGLYTEAEVLADSTYDENRLTANALNSKMTFDTQNANEMYRYQLYRGELNENPVIDLDHTISQLQESGDLFTEQLTIDGIYPMVEHAPAGPVVRNDRYFFFNNDSTIAGPFTQENPYNVENADELAYVPVIWTMGFRTGRLDDLNNSYGSDIKRNVLSGANIITTVITNENATNKFEVEGSNLDYYVYAPKITIDAKIPAYPKADDGDEYTYEPYMYRVWCDYKDARKFAHVPNPDGHTRLLVDAGELPDIFLIGEVKVADLPANSSSTHVVIGDSIPSGADWENYRWAFGAPKNTAGQFKFIIRYYYKKVVTDAAPSTSGLRGNRDGEDYYVFETSGSADNIVTGVNELWSGYGKVVISQTYVNAQGMQSDKPFDGLNIVVTRFSDGTTTTTKVVR